MTGPKKQRGKPSHNKSSPRENRARAEKQQPRDWRDLQVKVKEIYSKMGCEVQENVFVTGVRAKHQIDVMAGFHWLGLLFRTVIECKFWNAKVKMSQVLSLKSVLEDIGAEKGVIVSKMGFQRGAKEMVKSTAIELLTYEELLKKSAYFSQSEIENLREPLVYNYCCLTERLKINPESEIFVDSTSEEKYVLRNRSTNLPVKETRKMEDWVYPETEVEEYVLPVPQYEMKKMGYESTKVTEVCLRRTITNPAEYADGKCWKLIGSYVEFKDPLRPNETIGIEFHGDSKNAFKFQDYYVWGELPTEKVKIKIIAPLGYSISITDWSVRDTKDTKVENVKEQLVSEKQRPTKDRTDGSIVWTIKKPILIYQYRVDFKIVKKEIISP